MAEAVETRPWARSPGEQQEPPKEGQEDKSESEGKAEQEAEQRSAIGAEVVHAAIKKEGEEELTRSTSALAWSGLAAGLAMGFSLVAEGLLRHYLPDEPWRPLVSKLGYSIGFLIVVLGRQQLFTENTLTPILPLMESPSTKKLLNVLRLWGAVLAANLVGALIFAWVVSSTNLFEPSIRATLTDVGKDALMLDQGFWTIFIKAIFAGWLIALMVWLLPVAETARVAVIIIMTYLVGLAGLAHIIAGSVETMYAIFRGQGNWGDYLVHWLIPTLLGNVAGGVMLVAALNHAQVMSGGGKSA